MTHLGCVALRAPNWQLPVYSEMPIVFLLSVPPHRWERDIFCLGCCYSGQAKLTILTASWSHSDYIHNS
jgi:hypothetical protein